VPHFNNPEPHQQANIMTGKHFGRQTEPDQVSLKAFEAAMTRNRIIIQTESETDMLFAGHTYMGIMTGLRISSYGAVAGFMSLPVFLTGAVIQQAVGH